MASIIFINRYFFPDYSATSQLLSDLAFGYAEKAGAQVVVITSRQIYDDPQALLSIRDSIHGVEVHRVWTARFGRKNLFGRALDYATFYLSSAFKLYSIARKGDLVVSKTDPPLISVIAALAVKLRGATLVNWVQDLFPEIATQLGVTVPKLVEAPICWLRNWSLRLAKKNIVLGDLMKERLLHLGVMSSSIEIIPNWTDETVITPVAKADNELLKVWGIEGKFIVGYSGNLGRAHEYNTILGAAEKLSNETAIVFLFVGGGALIDDLKREVSERNLPNFVFKPYQAREVLAKSLSTADVHLISLLPELEGLIVPSKFYGVLAAGRPVIFIGSRHGEIARSIKCDELGRVVGVGEIDSLVSSISFYYEQSRNGNKDYSCGRKLVETKYSKASSLAKWEGVIVSASRVDA